MRGEGHDDRIVQRGIDEALAGRDRLERAPVTPSWLAQTATRLVATARSIVRREPTPERHITAAAPNGTVTHETRRLNRVLKGSSRTSAA